MDALTCGPLARAWLSRLPALWLGLVRRGEQLSPWWVRDWPRHDRVGRPVPFDLARLQPGQYLLPVGRAHLTGALLPLQCCADPLARAQLEALWAAGPDRSGARAERLRRVGPFGREREAGAADGLLELDCSPALYRWLRLRFSMAVALGPGGRLAGVAPLPGPEFSGFATWLGGEEPILPVPGIQRFLSAVWVR